MRVHPPSMSAPRARWLAASAVPASVALVIGTVSMTPAAAVGGAPAKAASGAHPVAPTVGSLAIPEVSPARQAGLHAVSGLPASGGAHLVALVQRPTVEQFSMVAVTWESSRQADGLTIQLRTRYAGHWTGWTKLGVDADGPSVAESSSPRGGTTPYWVGHATGVEVAVYAVGARHPNGLSVATIDPGTSAHDATVAGTSRTDQAKRSSAAAGSFPSIPNIVTRAQWGADESLGSTCWDPRVGTRFDAVIVHHTAGTNSYSRREAASVVRGVLAYHTVSRGWCDIGYNFLIDRYGTIYEGRAGGIRQPVRGAHAGDYNVDTTGISLMGNFDIASPTGPMKRSLVALVAWRLGTAYHGAYGHPFLFDGRFDRISGHRDVMSTACPGQYVYAWLPHLRKRVAARLSGFESPIEKAWRADGGGHSRLGPVRVGERMQAGGHNTRFDGGRMYKSSYGLFTFYPGQVLHYYLGSGGVRGDLGYPESGVNPTATSGLTAKFAGGRVYWSDSSNSHSLRHGAILRRYLHVGGAAGRLGFPTSSVHSISGGRRAGFEHGYITYDRSTRKTTVTTR
ncbi:MAG: hypothetical protein QOD35_2447 [Nocardioidaceae bacterium]|nr:hypothetical protein [Nocardioidaceae bacterium]